MKAVSINIDSAEITVDNVTYLVDVYAEGNCEFIPGRMYMSNGDPGYPDEEDFEITHIDAIWHGEDDNEIEIEPSEKMCDTLYEYLMDAYVNGNWDYDLGGYYE